MADFLFVVASFIWLIDWTILDRVTNQDHVRDAMATLEREGVLVVNSFGIRINAKDGSEILPDPGPSSVLIDSFRNNKNVPSGIDWDHVCCLAYRSMKTPIEDGGDVVFRTLAVGTVKDGKLSDRFIPIASQNEINGWLQWLHQRNIEMSVGFLLFFGYIIQTVIGLSDPNSATKPVESIIKSNTNKVSS